MCLQRSSFPAPLAEQSIDGLESLLEDIEMNALLHRCSADAVLVFEVGKQGIRQLGVSL